ncbi:TonB-dependent receptor [Novosphingobium sp. 1949]|uniref:TonB-dependent receptor n=1 Tax=Novosphingobium organovorum TaxID=2930092 RepID=A0ABT0B9W5_9SPHN|nr:TonB-dependent receptor [Novosphingobium organovorum]MCJ2181813.1 TonB-dependent receptor [Novosphingobium organovorum]
MHTISKSGLRCALLATVSVATLFASSAAQAQSAAPLASAQAGAQAAASTGDGAAKDAGQKVSDDTMREIIVTAQFRSQKLQDTPLAITAVDSALLEARNQTDISQIAAQAPNVQMTQMGGAFGASMAVYIRGIGQYDFNPAYEPGVGMYVDDVYYASLTGSIMDLLDLERVEVLRGPQGTLTGRNSIGGAIKMFSMPPEAEDSGSFEAAYGARNRIDLRGSMNFALTDNLFARVAGVYKRQDGYVDQIDYGCANPDNALGITAKPSTPSNCVMDKLGEKGYAGVRGALRFNPNDKLDWTVIGDYSYEKHTNAANVLTIDDTSKTDGINFICGKRCTYADFYVPAGGDASQSYSMPNETMFTGWGVSSNLKYDFTDTLKLQSITAYRAWHTTFGTDDDFTPDPNIVGGGYNDIKFHFFSQELRLSGSVGTVADWTVGGYYSDQKTVYFTRQDIRYIDYAYCGGLGVCNLQFTGNDPVNADTKALFGTVMLHPTSDLNVTAGIRYTKEHKDYTFVRKAFDGGTLNDAFGVGLLDGSTANYDGSRVDWRISADYHFTPDFMGYATVSTGFKGGGVVARPFTRLQAVNGAFDPETLTAYEMGFKTDFFHHMLRVNVAAFYNDYKNIQLPISDCSVLDEVEPGTDTNTCAAVTNAGDGHMYGAELEVSANPVDGLDFDASLSYINGAWDNIADVVGGSIKVGDPITTPNWRWSMGVQYRADLGNSGSLTPRLDLNGLSKQSQGRLTLTSPLDYIPAYMLANARLTWKNANEDLAISFEVQNLFDKYYLLPLRFTAVYGAAGTGYSTVGRPREWAVSINKKF